MTTLAATVELVSTASSPVAIPVSVYLARKTHELIISLIAIKLSYVMSEFFERENRAAEACSFAGNGTVNTLASTTQSATALASSCIADPNATFAPSAPATNVAPAPSKSGGNGNGNTNTPGSAQLTANNALVGLGSMAAIGAVTALWTLL